MDEDGDENENPAENENFDENPSLENPGIKVETVNKSEEAFDEALDDEQPLGRGQRKRVLVKRYEPSFGGQTYRYKSRQTHQNVNQLGAVNLTHRGQRYLLKDGVINVNLVGKPGVLEDCVLPNQFDDGVINLNTFDQQSAPMDDIDVEEHLVGLIMA